MTAQITWLEDRVDPGEVGARAASMAALRGAGVTVPKGFCLGRKLQVRLTAAGHERWLDVGKLPADVHAEVQKSIAALGGSYAIRRSPRRRSRRSPRAAAAPSARRTSI